MTSRIDPGRNRRRLEAALARSPLYPRFRRYLLGASDRARVSTQTARFQAVWQRLPVPAAQPGGDSDEPESRGMSIRIVRLRPVVASPRVPHAFGARVGWTVRPRATRSPGRLRPKNSKSSFRSTRSSSLNGCERLTARGTPETFTGGDLRFIGMPVGGLCTGTLYLGGDGRLWLWNIFNKDVEGIDPKTVTYAGQQLKSARRFGLRRPART